MGPESGLCCAVRAGVLRCPNDLALVQSLGVHVSPGRGVRAVTVIVFCYMAKEALADVINFTHRRTLGSPLSRWA